LKAFENLGSGFEELIVMVGKTFPIIFLRQHIKVGTEFNDLI